MLLEAKLMIASVTNNFVILSDTVELRSYFLSMLFYWNSITIIVNEDKVLEITLLFKALHCI